MCMYVCVYGMVYTEEMVYTQQYGSCLCGIGRYWIRIRWSHTTRERKEVPKLQKKKKKRLHKRKERKTAQFKKRNRNAHNPRKKVTRTKAESREKSRDPTTKERIEGPTSSNKPIYTYINQNLSTKSWMV